MFSQSFAQSAVPSSPLPTINGTELTVEEPERAPDGKLVTSRITFKDIKANSFTEVGSIETSPGKFQIMSTCPSARIARLLRAQPPGLDDRHCASVALAVDHRNLEVKLSAAPKNRVINHEEHNGANDRDQDAIEIQPRNARHAESLKQVAAQHRPDNP
jgi:hypothetical protein